MKHPHQIDDTIGSDLINIAFTLYDRDYLNGWDESVTISQRVTLVIQQYELHKHLLYDNVDYCI